MDSKDGDEAVSGYDGTWVTGEWNGAGRVNGACGRSGGMNGEGGGSGADGDNGHKTNKNTTSVTPLTQTYTILQHCKAKRLSLTTAATQQTFPQTHTQSIQQT